MQVWAGLWGAPSCPFQLPGPQASPGYGCLRPSPLHCHPACPSPLCLLWMRPVLNPGWSHLKSTWKTLFLNKLTFWGSGWTRIWEDPTQWEVVSLFAPRSLTGTGSRCDGW